jgi:hypothetical protein
MALEGKVARILNSRELAINKGSDAGVKEGMEFKVVEPGMDIVDPDTEEPLGSIIRVKVRIRISEVRPRFSIGRTYELYHTYLDPHPLELRTSRREVTNVKVLRNKDPHKFYEESSYVEVGDLVVQLEDNEI